MSADERRVARLAEKAAAPLIEALGGTLIRETGHALAPWAPPGARSVARTMSEAGVICGGCTHPWGRHVTVLGCAAQAMPGNSADDLGRCGCTALPGQPTAAAA